MDELAILGGKPVRDRPFPAWPVYDDTEEALLIDVLRSRNWGQSVGLGPKSEELSMRFAAFCGVQYAIPVTNCTSALIVSLQAAGAGPGDEVIVPAYTFVATAFAALIAGASVRFVDIDPSTFCVDPEEVRNAINERTKAIIPVHLGGTPADMRKLVEIASQHGISIIEDCAQAHGATLDNAPVGSFGTAGCFSFHQTKNIACGEGGMITTDDAGVAELCGYELTKFGRQKGGYLHAHQTVAGNYGITEFQAAILLAQLDRNAMLSTRRSENAQYLRDQLLQVEGLTPTEQTPGTTYSANHVFFMKYDQTRFADCPRKVFVEALNAEGIPAKSLYPMPIYRQPAIATRTVQTKDMLTGSCYVESCPNAERISGREAIALPQNILIGERSDIDSVIDAINKVLGNLDKVTKDSALNMCLEQGLS